MISLLQLTTEKQELEKDLFILRGDDMIGTTAYSNKCHRLAIVKQMIESWGIQSNCVYRII
jgi:hypothetical protein